MLGKLFGSNARVKILKIFLLHPSQKYYIRQLARDLKLQVNSVRRELENLEIFGLLTSDFSINGDNNNHETFEKSKIKGQEKKYYKANNDFILFEEIKALVIKAQILYEKDFIEKLKKIGKPKLFLLSGFFVNDKNSLTDILLVGRFNKIKLLKLIKGLENELNIELNFTLMDNHEFRYRRDITDVFLYDILEGKNILVIDETDLKL
ncbi:MAG: hypothetical protein ABIE43_04485 [Patescibacteria group bacterium]